METKFKVGDKVRIKKDLVVDEVYSDCCFVEYMAKFKGEIATIIKRYSDDCYLIDIDKEGWLWAPEMLEKIDDK
jgi:hypothetical protein